MPRRSAAAAVVAAVALVAGACSSADGIGAAAGESAAEHGRRAVALAYWRLYNSLGHSVIRTDASGRFVSCPASSAGGIRYGVANAISALTPRQPATQFARLIQDRFGQAGWPLHLSGANEAGQRIYSATAGGISVRVRFFKDNLGPGAALTVEGTCLNAGNASRAILGSYSGSQADRYPDADATASPVPTTFPTPSS